MLKRYPHTGFLVTTGSTQDDNGDFTDEPNRVEIKGRYEPNNQSKSLDYSAKFYCKRIADQTFDKDETTFEFNDRAFKILQLHNYQNHTEIWLG